MVAVISMETLTEETEEELAAEQSQPSLQSPASLDDESGYEARLAAALAEWGSVGAKEIEVSSCGPLPPLPIVLCSRILTYEEAADIIIDSVNMRDYRHRIRPTVQRKGLKKLWHKFFGPPKVDVELIEERDLMFALAQVSFDTECKSHDQMVQTIYRKLTGSTYDCPRYGAHWETIGFQGNDPATDLRGCGILGLLQLLYLSTHQDNEAIAKDLYQISLHATQNFPFAIMGINMTKIALESLREDCLNKICNERQCVLPVLNDFYVGTYLIMFLSWTKHAATIHDTGYIIQGYKFNIDKWTKYGGQRPLTVNFLEGLYRGVIRTIGRKRMGSLLLQSLSRAVQRQRGTDIISPAEVAKFVKGSPLKVLHNLQHYRASGVHSHFCDEHFTGLTT